MENKNELDELQTRFLGLDKQWDEYYDRRERLLTELGWVNGLMKVLASELTDLRKQIDNQKTHT